MQTRNAFALLLTVMLSGCPQGNTPASSFSPDPVESPSTSSADPPGLSPAALVLNVPPGAAGQIAFEASASMSLTGAEGLADRLSWAVRNSAIATISASGLVTALATGSTEVILSLDGTPVATAALQVVDRGGRADVAFE